MKVIYTNQLIRTPTLNTPYFINSNFYDNIIDYYGSIENVVVNSFSINEYKTDVNFGVIQGNYICFKFLKNDITNPEIFKEEIGSNTFFRKIEDSIIFCLEEDLEEKIRDEFSEFVDNQDITFDSLKVIYYEVNNNPFILVFLHEKYLEQRSPVPPFGFHIGGGNSSGVKIPNG